MRAGGPATNALIDITFFYRQTIIQAIFNISDFLFDSLREGYRYDPTKFRIILPEITFVNPNKREMKIPEIALYVQDAIWPQMALDLSRRTIRRL